MSFHPFANMKQRRAKYWRRKIENEMSRLSPHMLRDFGFSDETDDADSGMKTRWRAY